MIDYESLAQDAMRGVVRTVLQRAAKSGLPGDHHFYISFDTEHLGVSLSKRLKEKYPNEMTIVLQHRFWDLIVTDERFEVKLTFDGIPERLVVPFGSIKVFFDPSVRYGLQFEEPDTGDLDPQNAAPSDMRSPRQPRKPRANSNPKKLRPASVRDVSQPAASGAANAQSAGNGVHPPSAAPALSAVETAPKPDAGGHVTSIKAVDDKPANGGNGAEIVSLDKFRKK